jgi:hypothetical protein
MRKAMCLLALFGSLSLLSAESPFTGKWKLNQDKSTATAGTVPKEETIVIADEGDKLNVTIAETGDDGTPVVVSYVVPVAGGDGEIKEGAAYDGVSAKRVNENTLDTTYTKKGKQVRSTHAVTSKDGKTMNVTVKGVDAQGKPADTNLTFDKQQ